MQTVDFYPQEFYEIPQQDNPAFGKQECMMIVKEHGSPKAKVMHIVPDPVKAVASIALFWRHERAVEYVEFFADNAQQGRKEE